MRRAGIGAVLAGFVVAAAAGVAEAGTISLTIDGGDAIYLAGRTDLAIPALGRTSSTFPLRRHSFVGTGFVQEQFPTHVAVAGGDVVRVLDPAVGGIDFFNGTGNFYGPEGTSGGFSNLTAIRGISAYNGPHGSLVGVFLNNLIPNGTTSPARIDFGSAAKLNFTSLSPGLGQVFFIGNGATSGGVMQQFVAPTGATRVFFGIADGFGFVGTPGAYEDNDGSYQIRVGINEVPTIRAVPLPPAALSGLGLLGLAALFRLRRRREL